MPRRHGSPLNKYAKAIQKYYVDNPYLGDQEVCDKLEAEFGFKVRRETYCQWRNKVEGSLIPMIQDLDRMERAMGKPRFVSVMQNIENQIGVNESLLKKIKKEIDDPNRKILDTVQFRDFINLQNSMTKQLELLAKIRGDIQTGNKITINFANDKESEKFMRWLNTKIKNIDKGHTINDWLAEYHKEMTRKPDELEIVDVEFSEAKDDGEGEENGHREEPVHTDEPSVQESSDEETEP